MQNLKFSQTLCLSSYLADIHGGRRTDPDTSEFFGSLGIKVSYLRLQLAKSSSALISVCDRSTAIAGYIKQWVAALISYRYCCLGVRYKLAALRDDNHVRNVRYSNLEFL